MARFFDEFKKKTKTKSSAHVGITPVTNQSRPTKAETGTAGFSPSDKAEFEREYQKFLQALRDKMAKKHGTGAPVSTHEQISSQASDKRM